MSIGRSAILPAARIPAFSRNAIPANSVPIHWTRLKSVYKNTGGVITQDGLYMIHTFLSSGIFVAYNNAVGKVLVVGGGGGGTGGKNGVNYGSGGGGGNVIENNAFSLTTGEKTVVIGQGGTPGPPNSGKGGNGGQSQFDSIIALGGIGPNFDSRQGGRNESYNGGTGSANYQGGGGAGAGGNGSVNVGGIGLGSDIPAIHTHFGGGGAGGDSGTAVDGGGNVSNGVGSGDAVANRGGGGGGGNDPDSGHIGGYGGSGIVIVRCLKSDFSVIESVPYVSFKSTQGAVVNNVSLRYCINFNNSVYINWGYGNDIKLLDDGNYHTITSNYSENTIYDISIYGVLSEITGFELDNEPTVSGSFSIFSQLSGLDYLGLNNCNFTGSTIGLSSVLTILNLLNCPGVTVYFDSLSRLITHLEVVNCNPESPGLVQNLPPNLLYLLIWTNNKFGGDLHSFPSTLTYLDFSTLRGDLFYNTFEHLPTGLTHLRFYIVSGEGYNSQITGNLNSLPSGLNYLGITKCGYGIACNINMLPSGVEKVLLEDFGQDKVSGTGVNLNSAMQFFGLNYCPSTLFSLAVANVPSGVFGLQLWNAGVITGLIENLPSTFDDAQNGGVDPNIIGNCPLMLVMVGSGLTYGGGNLPVWRDVTIAIDLQWNAAMVDAFLINFASRTQVSAKTRQIAITGTRTAASDAAVATLAGKNKIVTMY